MIIVRSRELLDKVVNEVMEAEPDRQIDRNRLMVLKQNARLMDSFAEETEAHAFDIKYCKDGTFDFKIEVDLISECRNVNRFYELVRASEKIRFKIIHKENLLTIFNMPGIWTE